MKIDNNLDYERPILDQINTFAVAVNHFKPKEEDYTYKYFDLNQEHKDVIWGMACAIDSLSSFESNREMDIVIEEDPETFKKIKNEIEENVINRAFNWMVGQMCETLISFLDDEE